MPSVDFGIGSRDVLTSSVGGATGFRVRVVIVGVISSVANANLTSCTTQALLARVRLDAEAVLLMRLRVGALVKDMAMPISLLVVISRDALPYSSGTVV